MNRTRLKVLYISRQNHYPKYFIILFPPKQDLQKLSNSSFIPKVLWHAHIQASSLQKKEIPAIACRILHFAAPTPIIPYDSKIISITSMLLTSVLHSLGHIAYAMCRSILQKG